MDHILFSPLISSFICFIILVDDDGFLFKYSTTSLNSTSSNSFFIFLTDLFLPPILTYVQVDLFLILLLLHYGFPNCDYIDCIDYFRTHQFF